MKMGTRFFIFTYLVLLGFSVEAQDSCLVLNGSKDFVAIPSINMTDSSELTLEAWINPSSVSRNNYMHVLRQNGKNIPSSWLLSFQLRGSIFSFGVNTTTGYKELDHKITGSDFVNKWRHVAGVYNGSKLLMYIDGLLVDSVAHTGKLVMNPSISAHRIGSSAGLEHFEGKIDEVRIWHKARTHAEILERMNCSIDQQEPGLLGSYNFNKSFVGTVKDGIAKLGDGTLRYGAQLDQSIAIQKCCRMTQATLNEGFCGSYTSPSSRYVWSTPGTYTDTVANKRGCDSIITIYLSNAKPTATLSQVGHGLVADTVLGATYQWLDCGNSYGKINGATSTSFMPSTSGTYAVEVTSNGCSDTSSCTQVTIVGIQSAKNTKANIYPNPSSGVLRITPMASTGAVEVTLFNVKGQAVLTRNHSSDQEIIVQLPNEPGVYYLALKSNSGTERHRVVRL